MVTTIIVIILVVLALVGIVAAICGDKMDPHTEMLSRCYTSTQHEHDPDPLCWCGYPAGHIGGHSG